MSSPFQTQTRPVTSAADLVALPRKFEWIGLNAHRANTDLVKQRLSAGLRGAAAPGSPGASTSATPAYGRADFTPPMKVSISSSNIASRPSTRDRS
jgi:hypothetical protein